MSWVKLIVAIIWIFLHKTYFFEFLGGNMYFMFILEVGKETFVCSYVYNFIFFFSKDHYPLFDPFL